MYLSSSFLAVNQTQLFCSSTLSTVIVVTVFLWVGHPTITLWIPPAYPAGGDDLSITQLLCCVHVLQHIRCSIVHLDFTLTRLSIQLQENSQTRVYHNRPGDYF